MREKLSEEKVRRARTISMNEIEIAYAEKIRDAYKMHSVSDAVRFLIYKEIGLLSEKEIDNKVVK